MNGAPGMIHIEQHDVDCYSLNSELPHGGVAEWLKAPVLKTGRANYPRGFESHPLRFVRREDATLAMVCRASSSGSFANFFPAASLRVASPALPALGARVREEPKDRVPDLLPRVGSREDEVHRRQRRVDVAAAREVTNLDAGCLHGLGVGGSLVS